ncbi:MAG TPA: c-type cytochrome [Candidatus Binatia bacterium]|nr:c-type cytochrome [Candidatus Binatia bacterium]
MNTARANKVLLLASSLITLALLVVAAYRENVAKEWRQIQRDYRAQLPPQQAEAFEIQLRQVYNPPLHATDRCISCHVGMAPGETGIKSRSIFTTHPDVGHDPLQYGCVVCHGGQGRATEKADAHGTAPHWPEPMLPKQYAYAGCGSCHTHLAVPNLAEVARGGALIERYDCLACHALDKRGGTLRPGGAEGVTAPDLSRIGGAGVGSEWYLDHFAKHREASAGPWRASFGEMPAPDRGAITAFLQSRVGAPGLVEAKATFHSLGCRGCHKIGGVGGDDGPDLSREGEKDPARLDYSHVAGEHTFANWLKEHFNNPAQIVANSGMPLLGLRETQVEQLVLYLLSLRRSDYPEAYWPRDRIRAERFAEREFATDGATLFGTFCAACHGPRGEGMRYPGAAAFPAIGNADFLAIASDRFLHATIQHGRPGRRMPAWGEKDGGLRPAEVDAVVAYIRLLGGVPSPAETEPRRWVNGSVEDGKRLFAANCATCHGADGEGKEGPQLHNQSLLQAATDRYLVETVKRGRHGTAMPTFAAAATTHRLLSDTEIETTVSFIRSWEVSS